jgi:hypothetical protein
MLYIQKPNLIEATQWFKNGDHPDDNLTMSESFDYEGEVVRRYRHPTITGKCPGCGVTMNDHGWIDSGGAGERVCPGNYIVTETNGISTKYISMKPDVFRANYFEYLNG